MQKSDKNGDAFILLLSVEDFDSSKQPAAGCRFVALMHVKVMQGTTLFRPSFETGVFVFFKTIRHEIAFSCTRESAVFFLITKARLRLYVNRCHISTDTHKFKSAVQKSSGPFPKVSVRVPKIWSAVKNQERRVLYYWLLCQNLGVPNCYTDLNPISLQIFQQRWMTSFSIQLHAKNISIEKVSLNLIFPVREI